MRVLSFARPGQPVQDFCSGQHDAGHFSSFRRGSSWRAQGSRLGLPAYSHSRPFCYDRHKSDYASGLESSRLRNQRPRRHPIGDVDSELWNVRGRARVGAIREHGPSLHHFDQGSCLPIQSDLKTSSTEAVPCEPTRRCLPFQGRRLKNP